MQAFFEAYLERLESLHAQIETSLDGLPKSALDWKPAQDIPSLCVLVTHLSGAERYWIGDVAGQEPSGRDRDAEFRAQGATVADLQERLRASQGYARQLLGRLTLEDLGAMHNSPRDGRQFSVAWALLHALEHTALHLGHVQIVRQLWEQNQNQSGGPQ